LKDFRKLTRERISERIKESLPLFERITISGDSNGLDYRYRKSENLAFGLIFMTDSRRLSFSVDVCITRSPSDAELDVIPLGDPHIGGPFNAPEDSRGPGSYRFALSLLWAKNAIAWQVRPQDVEATQPSDPSQVALMKRSLRGFPGDGWVRFDPARRDRWIQEHPTLYQSQLSHDEMLVYPLVDHMVERLTLHAMPFFEKTASC
jgi:hypothetical protein